MFSLLDKILLHLDICISKLMYANHVKVFEHKYFRSRASRCLPFSSPTDRYSSLNPCSYTYLVLFHPKTLAPLSSTLPNCNNNAETQITYFSTPIFGRISRNLSTYNFWWGIWNSSLWNW